MPDGAAHSDLTVESLRRLQMIGDEEWAVLEPSFPPPATRGRPLKWTLRHVFEAVLFVLVTGCQWKLLPPDFPPRSTVHRHFVRWTRDRLFHRLNHRVVMLDREREGREASPTAAVIDSKTVRGGVTGRISAYDGGKKIKGLKWHLMVDVGGRLLALILTAANVHDSRAAIPLVKLSRKSWPFVEKVWADKGYQGDAVADAVRPVEVEIVTGPKNQKGFIVQKRRWVVERSFSWIERNRRLLVNHEKLEASVTAYVILAASMVLVRRIAASGIMG